MSFQSIRQKVFGLGYSLLVFVCEKADDKQNQSAILRMTDTLFVDAERTADFQMTRGLRKLLDEDANEDDLFSFMAERLLTVDEHQLRALAAEVLRDRPQQGYLTISPALQWRLQYKRVIGEAGVVDGIRSVFKG